MCIPRAREEGRFHYEGHIILQSSCQI